MLRAHYSHVSHLVRIDSLITGDQVFLVITVCSIYATLHVSPTVVNFYLIPALEYEVYDFRLIKL
jgi:hypothetical protein